MSELAFIPRRLSELTDVSAGAFPLTVDAAGVDDITDPIQEFHDANPGHPITLDASAGAVFRVKKPFMYDLSTSQKQAVFVDFRGARVILDPALPMVGDFGPDPTVRAWCFPNTDRDTGWNRTTNVVTAAGNNAMGGGTKRKPKVILWNANFDGSTVGGGGAGVMVPNAIGCEIAYSNFHQCRFGIFPVGYADAQKLFRCSATSPLADSAGIWTTDNGDTHTLESCHGLGCGLTAYKMRGGLVIGTQVGLRHIFLYCDVKIVEPHTELDNNDYLTSFVKLGNSRVLIEGGTVFAAHVGSGVPASIYVDDSANLSFGGATELEIKDVRFKRQLKGEADAGFMPDVLIHSFHPDAVLKMRGATCNMDGATDLARTGVLVASDDPAIQAAIYQGLGICGGDYEIWQRQSAWVATPLGRRPVSSRTKPQPASVSITRNGAHGVITTARTYCLAARDELGNWALASAVAAGAAGSSGDWGFDVNFNLQEPCELVIWSADGATDPSTTPARWVRIPWSGWSLGDLLDTGTSIGGLAWRTWVGGDPVAATVAAVDHTIEAISLGAGIIRPAISASQSGDLQKTNDTSPADIPGLSVNLGPLTVFDVTGRLSWDATTIGDAKIVLVAPAGATGEWHVASIAGSSAGQAGSWASAAAALGAALSRGGGGIGTRIAGTIWAKVVTGAAGGILKLRGAQDASDATVVAAAVVSGGTGYAVNDVLTVVGGTFTVAAQVKVTAVSAGVITAVSIQTAGAYTVQPSNPVATTVGGGTGTGATFNLTFQGTTFYGDTGLLIARPL